jgi:hypothetical protein
MFLKNNCMPAPILFLIKLLKKWINAVGADYSQVHTIARYKLILDNRKSLHAADSKKERNNMVWIQLVFYFVMGIMFGAVIGAKANTFISMFLCFSALILISASGMMAEFSTLLFDTRDNTIIIPRPVSERTYLLAKILHIANFIILQTLSFSIVPIIVTIIKFNILSGLMFFLNTLLCSIFTIFLTQILYLGLMKFTSGERFKDIVSYFQIVMAIIFMGGYQLIPELLEYLESLQIQTNVWWMQLIPSTWMAGSMEGIASLTFTKWNSISLILSVLMPALGLWIVVKYLAPGYIHKLAILEQGDIISVKKISKGTKFELSKFFARFVTYNTAENIAMSIIWKITSRDRTFKTSMYPFIGWIFVMIFIFVFRRAGSLEDIASSQKYLYILYIPFFFLYSIYLNIKYSNNFKAAWIYAISPITHPGEIISGAVKAILIKLYLPVYLACGCIAFYFWKTEIILHFITAMLISLSSLILLISLTKLDMPFSAEVSSNKRENIFISFLMMFLSAALGLIHFILVKTEVNMWIPIFILVPLTWYAFRFIRKAGWNKIEPIKL